jgi:hypothetical protein
MHFCATDLLIGRVRAEIVDGVHPRPIYFVETGHGYQRLSNQREPHKAACNKTFEVIPRRTKFRTRRDGAEAFLCRIQKDL